jgi:hypothetical protein
MAAIGRQGVGADAGAVEILYKAVEVRRPEPAAAGEAVTVRCKVGVAQRAGLAVAQKVAGGRQLEAAVAPAG